ncbi:hypothetical protein BGX38DRAFT_1141551 [Terfezia claveryi]|nr:hypothetical protein BGX38DRAFT_1141551 [Terfezia claveryi]
MTRSHKANDPVHGVEPQGAQDSVPRNFGKYAAHTERAKKNGGGKANWGRDGDELIDSEEFVMHKARRRSNSKGHIEDMFVQSKFEEHEEEPVFHEPVQRVETASSASSESSEKS